MNQTRPDTPSSAYYDDLPSSIFFSYLVMVFTFVALIVALLYQLKSLTILSSILLLLAFSLRVWGKRSSRALCCTFSVDKDRVFPGESVRFGCTIENQKFLPVIVRLRLNISGLLAGAPDDTVISCNSGLLWYQKAVFSQVVKPIKRGCYRADSARLISADFFGFFPRRKILSDTVNVLVFPKPILLKPLPLLKRIMFGKSAVASPVHDPVHILGTTDYHELTPAANIHWKASARHDKLQEKIFEPTEQEKVLLILELDGFYHERHEASFEKTIEAVAAMAVTLVSQHHAIGFLTNGCMVGGIPEYLAIKGGKKHLSVLSERLARMDLNICAEMETILNMQAYFPVGISCIYFSYHPSLRVDILYRKRIPVVNVITEGSYMLSVHGAGGMSGVRSCLLSNFLIEE